MYEDTHTHTHTTVQTNFCDKEIQEYLHIMVVRNVI